MARRVTDPATWEDEWYGQLDFFQRDVWHGLRLRLADDQGRLRDNAVLIRSQLYPYREVPTTDVTAALDEFVTAGRLIRYEVADRSYLQIAGWWQEQKPQWASASDHPAPPGWTDRIRTRLNGDYVKSGWETAGGFLQVKGSGERARVKPSGERAQVKPSGEPLGLAHETDPDPDMPPDPSTLEPWQRFALPWFYTGHFDFTHASWMSDDEVDAVREAVTSRRISRDDVLAGRHPAGASFR